MAGSWSKRKGSHLEHLKVWKHNQQVFSTGSKAKKEVDNEQLRLALEHIKKLQKHTGG